MSAEIEVIIDSEPIYSIDINTVDEIFEITTSNIENIYELVVIEPSFFSSSFLDDSTSSPIKTYSSEKIETIVTQIEGLIEQKQDQLTLKTINGQEIIGEGDVEITAQQTPIDVQIFTSSETWVKPTRVKWVRVLCIGAGSGGGSGRVGASGTVIGGGGSGARGAVMMSDFKADFLPSNVPITIGAGGNGGLAISTTDTNGNAGSSGGKTTFGNASNPAILIEATGSTGGSGGTTAGGTAGNGSTSSAVGNIISLPGSGGGPGNIGTSTYGGTQNSQYTQAGAGGGGISSSNIAGAGNYCIGFSTDVESIYQPTVKGQLTVSNPSLTTGDGISGLSTFLFGGLRSSGGTGGGSSITGNGGKGGDGGIGSGGGGGGAALNGFSSGAGGNGGDGICIVWSW